MKMILAAYLMLLCIKFFSFPTVVMWNSCSYSATCWNFNGGYLEKVSRDSSSCYFKAKYYLVSIGVAAFIVFAGLGSLLGTHMLSNRAEECAQ